MNDETFIHPSSVVEAGAKLGQRIHVGPFCHVGPEVELGDGVKLVGHVTLMGVTSLGAGSTVYPHAVLGAPPQNAKHKGGRTALVIGANTTIREFVTMHAGTDTSRGETRIGDNGYFLAYSHVGHDSVVGRNATFANGATLGGHCEVGDHVSIGGLTAVHQFVRVGEGAFLGGCSAVVGDVIPYGIAVGNRAKLRGLNLVGLRRSGATRQEIAELRETYNALFDPAREVAENLRSVRGKTGLSARSVRVIDFVADRGKRHLAVPPLRRTTDDDGDA